MVRRSKDIAKWKLYQKTFKIDTVGVSNVTSYSQGKIHKSKVSTTS